ncbi:hypothetical protein [Pseudomonas oryzihabitans]|uniref:hypothetical protein n=1 Tax=Pseudomonas oryzihabitans TaxID=47885 RepID=UPI0011A1CD34|nr:hypothetical protein [Pseudomonas oryzihabitans]
MASAKPPVQQSPFELHDQFFDDEIFPSLAYYSVVKNVPLAEVLACALYRMSAELSLCNVEDGQVRAVAQAGAEMAREVRHGQH